MQTNIIYVILGASGAGKDYLARKLQEVNPSIRLHKFARPGKSLFEQIYSLPVGFMDNRELRLQICPGTDESYLDRFIYWFHNQHQIFPPHFFLGMTIDAIKESLQDPAWRAVVVTDVRDPLEVDALIALMQLPPEGVRVRLCPIHIHRAQGLHLSSDKHLYANISTLKAWALNDHRVHPLVVVHNNGDLSQIVEDIIGHQSRRFTTGW